jgi:hypothetical protein
VDRDPVDGRVAVHELEPHRAMERDRAGVDRRVDAPDRPAPARRQHLEEPLMELASDAGPATIRTNADEVDVRLMPAHRAPAHRSSTTASIAA